MWSIEKSTGLWFKQMVYFDTVDSRNKTNFNHVSYQTCSIELSIASFIENVSKQGSMDMHLFVREDLMASYLILDNVLDVF